MIVSCFVCLFVSLRIFFLQDVLGKPLLPKCYFYNDLGELSCEIGDCEKQLFISAIKCEDVSLILREANERVLSCGNATAFLRTFADTNDHQDHQDHRYHVTWAHIICPETRNSLLNKLTRFTFSREWTQPDACLNCYLNFGLDVSRESWKKARDGSALDPKT